MTSVIQHYRSLTAGSVPASLVAGRIGFNHTDGKLFYSNAAGAVGSRSLRDYGVVIAKGNVSAAANLTLSIDPATIGIMRGFLLRINGMQAVSVDSQLRLRFGNSGGILQSASTYKWFYTTVNSAGETYGGSDSSDDHIGLSNLNGATGTTALDGEILITTNDPTPTMLRMATWETAMRDSSGNIIPLFGHGWYTSDIDITQIRLLFGAGNINKIKYSLTGFL